MSRMQHLAYLTHHRHGSDQWERPFRRSDSAFDIAGKDMLITSSGMTMASYVTAGQLQLLPSAQTCDWLQEVAIPKLGSLFCRLSTPARRDAGSFLRDAGSFLSPSLPLRAPAYRRHLICMSPFKDASSPLKSMDSYGS